MSINPQSAMAPEAANKRIALIIASVRQVRVGPSIAALLHKHLTSHLERTDRANITLDLVELADHPLPMFDDAVVPASIKDSSDYSRPEAREWSEFVKRYDAYVFCTPQYNWSVPASLKNALDYLYHEWSAKPAFVTSYGGHGGDKAAAHLLQILQGLRMRPVEETVQFPMTPSERMKMGTSQGKLLGGEEEYWKEQLKKAEEGFDKMVELLVW